ncbi:hypothetical protein QBC46DRAFT_21223 [Diplogelasinospora grovesii]|uniref:Zn(2)-C6 fungal-type domain-containing protein n=1 Tax=Diplogelasinospora grovesii TaxID=303347 RepID=A0AAN6S0P2_9PEZI|nr:hypothetical protein QBC46DRAFT_21223 [Diplogelasinospora grovesii]
MGDLDVKRPQRTYPPLLPRGPVIRPKGVNVKHVAQSRRRASLAACQACRKRKSKCSAKRPVCSLCIRHKTECTYDGSENETPAQTTRRRVVAQGRELAKYDSLYQFLQTRDEKDVGAVLGRIRAGDTLDTVFQFVEEVDLLLHLHPSPSASSDQDQDQPPEPESPCAAPLRRESKSYLSLVLLDDPGMYYLFLPTIVALQVPGFRLFGGRWEANFS